MHRMDFISSDSSESSVLQDKGNKRPKTYQWKKKVKCCFCYDDDHWTSKCPLRGKRTSNAGDKLLPGKFLAQGGPDGTKTNKTGGSKCMSSGSRDGAAKRADVPKLNRRYYKNCSVRIGNLSDYVTEVDLKELVKAFGPVVKLYMGKDKQTGLCKGFAYVHFKFMNDAAKAIARLDRSGYHHLILTAEWSRPFNN